MPPHGRRRHAIYASLFRAAAETVFGKGVNCGDGALCRASGRLGKNLFPSHAAGAGGPPLVSAIAYSAFGQKAFCRRAGLHARTPGLLVLLPCG